MQVKSFVSSCYFQSLYFPHYLCYRFQFKPVEQSSNLHKQATIYEKLNLPAKPKKPLTPFFKFLSQTRPALVKEHPEAKITEIVKMAAQKWSAVDSKLKEKFAEKYKEEVADYSKILNQYENSLTPEQKAEIKRAYQHNLDVKAIRETKKKAKDLGRPKQPLSVFVKFLMSKANEQAKGQSRKDWISAVSQEWKSLSPNVKAKLEEERKKDYEKWYIELKAWEEKMMKEGNVDLVRTGSLLPSPKKKIRK